MMIERDPDLGRCNGYVIEAAEVEAHIACGWIIADDLAGMSGAGDVVLMLPPDEFEREGAA